MNSVQTAPVSCHTPTAESWNPSTKRLSYREKVSLRIEIFGPRGNKREQGDGALASITGSCPLLHLAQKNLTPFLLPLPLRFRYRPLRFCYLWTPFLLPFTPFLLLFAPFLLPLGVLYITEKYRKDRNTQKPCERVCGARRSRPAGNQKSVTNIGEPSDEVRTLGYSWTTVFLGAEVFWQRKFASRPVEAPDQL